ncbi:hypothetical protein [Streptomyces sp. DSS69]|uniref:hypothetical protein n=1 Tax=Streptomyces sp. DSS69 TaxID=3113369 RepID=UPI0031F87756
MENWREGARSGHTHEPNDVTVQLDGLGRQLAELPGEPVPPGGSERPVFVDESGRRSKTYRRLGWVVASLCAAYAVTLVLAVLGGNSTAPWLPLSGPKEEARAEEAEALPGPSESAGPSADDPAPAPGATGPAGTPEPDAFGSAAPSVTSITVPAGSGASTPSASASAQPPGPTTAGGGATKPAPTTSAAEPPVPTPPPSPEPEPPATTSAPAESPEPPVQEESAF